MLFLLFKLKLTDLDIISKNIMTSICCQNGGSLNLLRPNVRYTKFCSADFYFLVPRLPKSKQRQYFIGCKGSGDGQLSGPTGLVIDKFNQLIVCDEGNIRLQLFTLDGKFVTKITGQCFDVDSRLFPVAVNKNGNVLVNDVGKNCIYVFH